MTHQKPPIPDWAPPKRQHDPVEEVMHALPYGVYVIGSVEDGRPNGMIADWVMQVSFEPRLLAVSFEQNSRSLARIRANHAFTVNILEEDLDGLELARSFVQPANSAKVRGRADQPAGERNKLEGIEFTVVESGCPVLSDGLGWLACEARDFVEAGDHVLVIGQVLDGELVRSGDPLTSAFTPWDYSG